MRNHHRPWFGADERKTRQTAWGMAIEYAVEQGAIGPPRWVAWFDSTARWADLVSRPASLKADLQRAYESIRRGYR